MKFKRKILPLALYSISMGYVEAMVVVYLRKLTPPEIWHKITSYGNLCKLVEETGIRWSEQTREFATIVMLVCIAFLTGENKREKLASFLIAFGIWDIFYYIFLYIWLGWPEHLLAMDILFLIPCPWVSPVIVPIFISCILIITGLFLIKGEEKWKEI